MFYVAKTKVRISSAITAQVSCAITKRSSCAITVQMICVFVLSHAKAVAIGFKFWIYTKLRNFTTLAANNKD